MAVNLDIVFAVIFALLIIGNLWGMIFVYIPKPKEDYTPLMWAGAVCSLAGIVLCSMALTVRLINLSANK